MPTNDRFEEEEEGKKWKEGEEGEVGEVGEREDILPWQLMQI